MCHWLGRSTTGEYLESQQIEPDIRVRNDYAVQSKGGDQQLEAAVAALLKKI